MQRTLLILTVLAFAMTLGVLPASADNDGRDHSFSWFRDADGDGIPNCLDEDWVRPENGMGYMPRHGFGTLFPVTMTAGGGKVQHKHHLQYQQRKKKPATITP